MKIVKYIIALTALTAVSGCSESPSADEKESKHAFLSINTGINSTRSVAVTGSDFSHEAALNIIMKGGVERSLVYVLKKPSEAAGAWLPITGDGIKLTAADESVYALYPTNMSASEFDANTLTLTPTLSKLLDFQTPDDYNSDNGFRITFNGDTESSEVFMADGERDYMVGKGSNVVSNTVKTVNITMQHCAAIIAVRVIKEKENTSPGVIKAIAFENTVTGTKPLKRGSFSMADNTFTAGAEEMSYRRTMNNFAQGTYFAMMVYPANITAGDVVFTLEVDDVRYTIDVPARVWASGKILLYDVSLKAASATLKGPVDVYDWDETEDAHKHNFPLE